MPFQFVDRSTKKLVEFEKAGDVALYMIDVEMEKYLPSLDADYKEAFKMTEIIPGGAFCMMSVVSFFESKSYAFEKHIPLMVSHYFTYSYQNQRGLSWAQICILHLEVSRLFTKMDTVQ